MKSYLVPGLTATQLHALRQASVVFYDWSPTEIMFDETQLAPALKALGATATEAATDWENIFKLALRYTAQNVERPRQQQVTDDSPRARARAQYIKICAARMQGVIDEAQAALKARQKEVPGACNTFAAASRAAAVASEPLNEERKRAELADELQRIQEMPQVKEVRVVPGALLVYTSMLHATTENRVKVPIGEFLIRIQLDGADGGVRWFNGRRRVNGVRRGMNAPNVYADGKPFADEIVQTLIELIAQCQFAVVAELAIQFVESAEVGDQTAWMTR